jgi:hypothetical protein
MGVSYNDFISAVTNYYNAEAGIAPTSWGAGATWTEVSKTMGNVGINTDNYINYLENFPELFEITRNGDGTVLDASLKKYMYYGNVNGYNTNTGGALNSNKVPSAFADSTGLNISGITTKATTGKLTAKGGIGLKADTGLTAQGVVSTIGLGALAVGTGATLGKIIGDALYQANPEIWSSPSVSALSKTDFNKFVTTIKDDVGTVLHDGVLALWGVDGDTTTMYVDENALAYMTWYLNEQKFFNTQNVINDSADFPFLNDKFDFPLHVNYLGSSYAQNYYNNWVVMSGDGFNCLYFHSKTGDDFYNILGTDASTHKHAYADYYYGNYPEPTFPIPTPNIAITTEFTHNNKTVYYKPVGASADVNKLSNNITWNYVEHTSDANENSKYLAWLLVYNSTNVGKQFDPTGVGSVATALGALKNQYPDLWNNSIKRNTIQDDGSEDERTYVPIPIPKYNNPFDEQPTTGTPSQADPSVKPGTTPKDELDNVSDTTTKDPTQSDDPNTGGGTSPDIIVPTQQASALWAIYNPTLTQLNSLGAWLWSTNFIDQILKIFNDPMQAIIGLHKVYATPNISGSGNIKVGYLDSGVQSNIVGNQYTYIDCGTVSLREYYGNILDYSPYTTVQLYLPFIGIVSLDIADVSRSSINVKYGVDVLTGACLASVSIQRDNAGGVLYQYSGNCACQYPLSSGSYMGMVTGAIGAIGSLARGNIIGTGLSIAGMHTNIEHSGGFSGNTGAMGIKKPYLIISRPQSVINDGFPSIQGYPSNYFTRLGDCSGFTQIAECHVENIPATDKELDKIKDLLKEGVIL